MSLTCNGILVRLSTAYVRNTGFESKLNLSVTSSPWGWKCIQHWPRLDSLELGGKTGACSSGWTRIP